MNKQPIILHLFMIGKWYDMIASGKKREEYRSISDYWKHRLIEPISMFPEFRKEELTKDDFKHFDVVCFHRGFTNTTIKFKCDGISIGKVKPGWGPHVNEDVFVIKLGNKLSGK